MAKIVTYSCTAILASRCRRAHRARSVSIYRHLNKTMLLKAFTDFEQLLPYQEAWDDLAGDCVFRSWAWQSTWWKHYGEDRQLFVIAAFASEPLITTSADCASDTRCAQDSPTSGQLTAILPCYLESSFARGNVLRLIGDGEVCTDHLDVLCDPEHVERATKAIATFLVDHSGQWDTTDFTAVGVDCVGLNGLAEQLQRLGCQCERTPNENLWSIALPEDWDGFLALQSKSHRKQLRRLERRVLDTQQATWHLVESAEQLEVAWPILIDLHQRRRTSMGEPGCFASPSWAAFHRDLAKQMLTTGELSLSWLEIAGQPVAVEYHFAGDRTTWAYQGGVDPDRIDEEPGRLSMICTLQHAIAAGHQFFDLLRGDEAYKAHWRAESTETYDLRIVPARDSARWRFRAFSYLQRAARVARQVTNLLS